jgi:hypothetical protein
MMADLACVFISPDYLCTLADLEPELRAAYLQLLVQDNMEPV